MPTYAAAMKNIQKVALDFVNATTPSIPLTLTLPGETEKLEQGNINAVFERAQNPDSAAGFGGTVDSGGAARVHEVTGLARVRFHFGQGDPVLYEEVRALAVLLRNVYRLEKTGIKYRAVSVHERNPTPGGARIDVQFEYEFYEASN